MIITHVNLVLGTIKGHNTMPEMSSFEGACNWHANSRAVARELDANLSTISHLQRRFGEFGSMSNRPQNPRPHVWRRVCERFADVSVLCMCWGYGMGRCKLWTTGTIAFYRWQFECTKIP